jgi:peptidoglycan/xylan/chitin deacetylase (PgdA/CDA1 family)
MIIDDLDIYERRSNQTHTCIHCYTGEELPYSCRYNSWGFRSNEEYDQYEGTPVVLCLGDSFTVNQGDSVENSWPSLLEKQLETKCLNFGLDGAGNDTIKLIHDRIKERYKIVMTCVVYSYFHRRLFDGQLIQIDSELQDNIKFFEKHMLENSIYTFIPEWCWSKEEAMYIRSQHGACLPESYTLWDMPAFNTKKHRIRYLKKQGVDVFNSDGHHMNYQRNKSIADYFANIIWNS